METEEVLSCNISKYQEQLKNKGRIAVTFVAKEFAGTESFLEALGRAYEDGYFGEMEMAVIPIENQECNTLAEHEGVEDLPTTRVYSHGKVVGTVKPTDADATSGYLKTIEKLIDLSED